MTIGTNTARVSFACNGVSTVFPVPIQAYLATDFLVLATNNTTGASIVLVLNSDYTLAAAGTLAPTQWSLTTQSSQLASPYATGYTLQVILNPPEVQQTQYVQGQQFPSLAVQTNVDRLTQMTIRLSDQMARAILAPDGDLSPAMLLPASGLRKSTNLGFDANGNVALNLQLLSGTISTATLAPFLNLSQTSAEASVGVVPTAMQYVPGDVRRYGADPTGAAASDTAWANAILVCGATGGRMRVPAGTYLLNNAVTNFPTGIGFLNATPFAFDIEGDGPEQSVINMPNATTGWTFTGVLGTPKLCGEIRGLQINGAGTAIGLITFSSCQQARIKGCVLRNINGYAAKYSSCLMSRFETTFVSGAGSATSPCLVITGATGAGQEGTTFDWAQSYIQGGNAGCVNGVSVDFASGTHFVGGAIESCGIPLKVGCAADTTVGTVGGTVWGVDMEYPAPNGSPGTAAWYIEFGTGQSGGALTIDWDVRNCTFSPSGATNVTAGFKVNGSASVNFGPNNVAVTAGSPIHSLSTNAANAGVHIDANPGMFGSNPWVYVNGVQVNQATPLVVYNSRDVPQLPWEQELTLTGTSGSILVTAQGGYYKNVVTFNGGATTVTALTGGTLNQLLYMRDINGNTTLTGGGGANAWSIKSAFNTWGAGNLAMVAGVTYVFRFNGTCWVQL
jgi:hypothetical protein